MALGGFLVGADPKLNSSVSQLPLHLAEFFTARDPKTEVSHVVAAAGMHHNPMMPVVQPQVAAVGFTVIGHFHAHDFSSEGLPFIDLSYFDSDVAEFGYLHHWYILRKRRLIVDW
jgi:hypothetical protein